MTMITKKATGKFVMKPGSKQKDSPSTFRMDSPLKQLGMAPTGAMPTMGASPAMQTGPKVEKCHGADAACMKRNREARKKHSEAERMKRYEKHKKTGADFYVDSDPNAKRRAAREHRESPGTKRSPAKNYDKSKAHTGAGKRDVNKDTRAGYITKDGKKTNDASKSKYKERRAQSLRAQSIKKYGRRSPHYKTHNPDGSKK